MLVSMICKVHSGFAVPSLSWQVQRATATVRAPVPPLARSMVEARGRSIIKKEISMLAAVGTLAASARAPWRAPPLDCGTAGRPLLQGRPGVLSCLAPCPPQRSLPCTGFPPCPQLEWRQPPGPHALLTPPSLLALLLRGAELAWGQRRSTAHAGGLLEATEAGKGRKQVLRAVVQPLSIIATPLRHPEGLRMRPTWG